MQVKHIYWFAYFNMFSPSVRYRAKYPLDWIKTNRGITYTFVYPGYRPGNILHFIRSYLEALVFRKQDSLIVIQRVHTNFIYSLALRFLLLFQYKNTLYDLDDAEYFDHPSDTLNTFLKKCAACSVGSNAVQEYVSKYNKTSFLLTSPILAHSITKTKRNTVFTIGWIGDFGGAHRESIFTILFPALKTLDQPAKLIILGVRQTDHLQEINDHFRNHTNIQVEIPLNVDWENEKSVYQKVSEFDVGVCPLIDTEITRAKSAFKIKQYFSCGVPALGSPVGENARFIKHGENGFICNSSEEFRNAIYRFRDMPDDQYNTFTANAKGGIHQFDMQYYSLTLLDFYS